MKIILIRHGETYANVLYDTKDRILIGALESPITELTDQGKLQAVKTKEIIKELLIDEIHVSDLYRAQQTASIIFPERTVHTTKLLRERSLGSDEGKRVDDVFQEESAWFYHVDLDSDSLEECLTKKVPDGENYCMVIERCRSFLDQFDFHQDKTIAVVAHFHLIRCMIYTLLKKQPDMDMFQLMIPNAEPLIFEYHANKFHQVNLDSCLKNK